MKIPSDRLFLTSAIFLILISVWFNLFLKGTGSEDFTEKIMAFLAGVALVAYLRPLPSKKQKAAL